VKHKLTLWPSGEVISVNEHDSLLKQLKEAGKAIKSSCGGCATCSDCVVVVKSGEEHIAPPAFEEIRLLGNVFHITKERLSCQLKVTGDVTIDISAHEKNSSTSKNTAAPAKSSVLVRKKDEVVKRQEEKQEQREQKKPEQWFKHWEKDKAADEASKVKNLGGNKRPKPFQVPEDSGPPKKSDDE